MLWRTAQELDIAICVDRIQNVFDLNITRLTVSCTRLRSQDSSKCVVQSQWSGLRSFVSDKEFVIGFSEKHKGFMWAAGMGG